MFRGMNGLPSMDCHTAILAAGRTTIIDRHQHEKWTAAFIGNEKKRPREGVRGRQIFEEGSEGSRARGILFSATLFRVLLWPPS